MNTLTVQNIHSVWPTMQAKSVRVPSVQTMVARRLEGKRAATKVMIRYIDITQEELDTVIDALIEATRPAPKPEPVIEPLPSTKRTATVADILSKTKRMNAMEQGQMSDLLFLLSMLVAVGLGVWALTQWASAPVVTVVITLAVAVAAFAAFAFTTTRMITLRITNQ